MPIHVFRPGALVDRGWCLHTNLEPPTGVPATGHRVCGLRRASGQRRTAPARFRCRGGMLRFVRTTSFQLRFAVPRVCRRCRRSAAEAAKPGAATAVFATFSYCYPPDTRVASRGGVDGGACLCCLSIQVQSLCLAAN